MKVLIIDDYEMDLVALKTLVGQMENCEPVCFEAASKALDWCRENVPDIVLVDFMMPAPDGLEFLRLFRKMPGMSDIPVVVVTAAHERIVCYKALDLGANDFLTKPVDNVELRARIKNMLALRKAQKQLAERIVSLEDALLLIKRLEGILPICLSCKKINLEGKNPKIQESWMALDEYISEKTNARFSHGLCPECKDRLYPEFADNK